MSHTLTREKKAKAKLQTKSELAKCDGNKIII